MKILSIDTIQGHIVETDDYEYPTYFRFGKESWYNMMGESLETVWGDREKEMERMFQEAIKKCES